MATAQQQQQIQREQWDQQRQQRAVDVLLERLAQTHSDAGHEVELDGSTMRCGCGLTFFGSLVEDPLFGFVPTLAVNGAGRPMVVQATDELRAIALGTHHLLGINRKRSDAARIEALGDRFDEMARNLAAQVAEVEKMREAIPLKEMTAGQVEATARAVEFCERAVDVMQGSAVTLKRERSI